jgi:hypothetical protein
LKQGKRRFFSKKPRTFAQGFHRGLVALPCYQFDVSAVVSYLTFENPFTGCGAGVVNDQTVPSIGGNEACKTLNCGCRSDTFKVILGNPFGLE